MTVLPPLIEQWFPAAAVGAESLRERGSAKAFPPINMLHVWWARRPLAASRAVILASILPQWPSDDASVDADARERVTSVLNEYFTDESSYHSWFLRTVGIHGDPVATRKRIAKARELGSRFSGDAYGYKRAFTTPISQGDSRIIHALARARVGSSAEEIRMLDPFGGGGSIPFEGVRIGLDVASVELNPVAYAIERGTFEFPLIDPGIADEVRRFGRVWAAKVKQELAPYFPAQAGERVLDYVWAHAVRCPTTHHMTPLSPNYWLDTTGHVAVALRPSEGTLRTEIVEGDDAAQHGDRTTYRQGTGTSIWTGETLSANYIVTEAQEGRMGFIPLATVVTGVGGKGRAFRSLHRDDLVAIDEAESALSKNWARWQAAGLIPEEEIPTGNYDRGHRRYGMSRWCDLFSPRQLFANLTILEKLRETVDEARGELSAEKLAAVEVYLAFALDKIVDYNSRMASWDSTRRKVRNTFDKHNYAFKWAFAEFECSREAVPWAVENIAVDVEKIAKLLVPEDQLGAGTKANHVTVRQGSATSLPIESGAIDVIVTDPPYYDNVMYAECSDFFYVWLKRSAPDVFGRTVSLDLTDKELEAVANPALFKGVATPGRRPSQLADARYEELMTSAFREAARVLTDDGVMTVMFTHKRVDAWNTLGRSLIEAGFSIHSSWPVYTESENSTHQAKKNAAQATIMLACRKRADSESAWWSDLKGDVARTAREAAQRMSSDGIRGVDLTLATFGPVLGVVSRRWPVYTGKLTDDGQQELLSPDIALDLAREEVAKLKKRGLLGGRDVNFDPLTDWWLLAWSDFGAATFPAGEALKLSIAMHLDLDDVTKQNALAESSSGNVTILAPAQRRTKGKLDPSAIVFKHAIDELHALMVVYDDDGARAAKAWLDERSLVESPRLTSLVEAALNAVPRARTKTGFARPEARILDSMRTTLFDQVPAPVDEEDDIEPAQLELAASEA